MNVIIYLMQHAFVPEGFWKTLCQIFSQHDQEMKGLQMELYLMFNQDIQLRCSIKMRGAAEVAWEDGQLRCSTNIQRSIEMFNCDA